MQEQIMRHEDILEELNEVKAQLRSTERERDSALNEVKEIKKQINNVDVHALKDDLQNAKNELKVKDDEIETLKSETNKLKQLELTLTEKETSLQIAKDEANNYKSSLAQTERLLSDSKKKADRLAIEMGRMKVSEAKLSESFAAQKAQFEQSSALLEKSKLQIISLEEQVQELLQEIERKDKESREEIDRLRNEILVLKENAHKSGPPEIRALLDEINILNDELKQALKAEDASKTAMDGLAVALKEVATESNKVKEKLTFTQRRLQIVEEENSKWKTLVKNKEEAYNTLVKESNKEKEHLNNTINWLRLEVEESLLAFNQKEKEFVKCIKSTEDEKNTFQEECNRMGKSLQEAEENSEKSKEENKKLRDILKHALNEANAAKEASALAQEENSYLKDALSEKDKALGTLAQETERLRINEAEANETIKELKRVITSGSKKEIAKLERENKEQKKESEHSRELKKGKDHSRELKKVTRIVSSGENSDKEPRERKLSNSFSFDLNQLWPSVPSMTCKSSKDFEEDFDEDDALGGSIFDLVESPMKELPQTRYHNHRRTISACSSEENLGYDQSDEDGHSDDMEIDKASHGKRKALLRRFGDLLRRKNSHPHTHSQSNSNHPPKDLPHPPKEVPPKEIPA